MGPPTLLPLLRCALFRSRPLRNTIPYRTLANATSPGQSSNAANPVSSNPESQSVNTSRGKESRHADTPDLKSVQSPISSQTGPTSEQHAGEEQTPTDAKIKNDPSEPKEKKRKNVEEAGTRKMGPEDEQ